MRIGAETHFSIFPCFCFTFSKLRAKYLEKGPHRIGKGYKKAIYVEYTDHTFTVVKHKSESTSSKGILGPVLRGEVGDRFKVQRSNTFGKILMVVEWESH